MEGDITLRLHQTDRRAEQDDKSCDLDSKILANILDSLIPDAPNLEHVCLQMGSEHYLGSHDISAMDMISDPCEALFHKRLPRLNNGDFSYYNLEDVLSAKLGQSYIKISWSFHRPTVILLSFSPLSGSSMNLLVSVVVYAAICKEEGMRFRFSGNSVKWEELTDASDADVGPVQLKKRTLKFSFFYAHARRRFH